MEKERMFIIVALERGFRPNERTIKFFEDKKVRPLNKALKKEIEGRVKKALITEKIDPSLVNEIRLISKVDPRGKDNTIPYDETREGYVILFPDLSGGRQGYNLGIVRLWEKDNRMIVVLSYYLGKNHFEYKIGAK